MTKLIHIKHKGGKQQSALCLPSSKSISNRLLILQKLYAPQTQLINLSKANDTLVLSKLLKQENPTTLNAQDAGTAFRFLTAWLAIKNFNSELQGTKRMSERPIKPLVDALLTLGCKIQYIEKEGYPPLCFKATNGLQWPKNGVQVSGEMSSQFISALLMISGVFKGEKKLILTDGLRSVPYIQMTLDLMTIFGFKTQFNANEIFVSGQPQVPKQIKVEPDWSSAAFWYAYTAATQQHTFISDLSQDSIQGDKATQALFIPLGVNTQTQHQGLKLSFTKTERMQLTADFNNIPDVFPAWLIAACLQKRTGTAINIAHLRHKESDRIAAMVNELSECGVEFNQEINQLHFDAKAFQIPTNKTCKVYSDHRLAMAFSLLSIEGPVTIENPDCVNKSYPSFWHELQKLNFGLHTTN